MCSSVEPFRSLSLVYRGFHRILVHCVIINVYLYVTGSSAYRWKTSPIRSRLLNGCFQHHPLLRTTSSDWGLSIPEIHSICGKVWHNPKLLDTLMAVRLWELRYLSEKAQVWVFSQIPSLFPQTVCVSRNRQWTKKYKCYIIDDSKEDSELKFLPGRKFFRNHWIPWWQMQSKWSGTSILSMKQGDV